MNQVHTVWAISDLHRSGASRRDVGPSRHAARWRQFEQRIERAWVDRIGSDDLVLIPGDFSAARNHRDVQVDLAWLERLPGRKVLSAGNHDGWFNNVGSVRRLLRASQQAVGGDAIEVGAAVVCGTRGAAFDPSHIEPDPLMQREIDAIDRALEQAQSLRTPEAPLFVMWHYPPFDSHGEPGPLIERLTRARATACVYGHVHQMAQWSAMVQGVVDGVRYACVAADAIGFAPLGIWSRAHV